MQITNCDKHGTKTIPDDWEAICPVCTSERLTAYINAKEQGSNGKFDRFSSGCASVAGETLGKLTVYCLVIYFFRHEIANSFAWVAAHVRIIP